jgi:mutator protein MutT
MSHSTKNSKIENPIDNPIDVSAGLVFRDGKLLITQRPHGAHLGGLWEFPGGKREPNESSEQCLIRELREELDIEVEVGELFDRLEHRYPEKIVRLSFFRCRWKQREPRALGCPAFKWTSRAELKDYEFPAADARVIQRLHESLELWRREQSGS